MAGFFVIANALALAWTLLAGGPYMDRTLVVALIAISTSLLPLIMWGLFKLPRLVTQLLVMATTLLVAGAIYGSGDAASPLSFLFLWAIPYTLAFFTYRQAAMQIGLAALARAAALAGGRARLHLREPLQGLGGTAGAGCPQRGRGADQRA